MRELRIPPVRNSLICHESTGYDPKQYQLQAGKPVFNKPIFH